MGGKAGPLEDAARTAALLRESAPTGAGAGMDTLRLDANQAWTMEEALLFSSALAAAAAASPAETSTGGGGGGSGGTEQAPVAGVDLGGVEYLEEPLRDPRSLGKFWECSGGILPYALDESLGMGREVFSDNVSEV